MEKEENYKKKLENIAGEAYGNIDSAVSPENLSGMLAPLRKVESNIDRVSQNYRTRLKELRDISHGLLREQLKDTSMGPSRYNTESWDFESSLGKGANEVYVEMKYSGIRQRGNKFFNFIKGLFWTNEESGEVSLQASLRYGTREESIPPFVFDLGSLRKPPRYVSEGIANYLHQVVRHAVSISVSDKNKDLDSLNLYGWFEDNIVCKTARLLGSNELIPIYLECAVKYNIDDIISRAEKQFLSDAEKEKAIFGNVLESAKAEIRSTQNSLLERLANPDSEMVRCINHGKERIKEVINETLGEIERYEKQTYERLEKDIIGKINGRRSELERELSNLQKQRDELEKNLARKKWDIPKSRLYFINELAKIFPDYDTCGVDYDIEHEKRAEYGRALADQLVKNKCLLKDEDVMKIISAFSASIYKSGSGGKKFNAKDMQTIMNNAISIASRIGPGALDTVVSKIREIGAKRRVSPDKIMKVLDNLL